MTDFTTLTIRGQRSDDLEQLLALWSNPAILLNSLELPYMSDDLFRDHFANPPADMHTLIAEAGLASGRRRIVGMAWLNTIARPRRRHVGRVGVIIYPDYADSDAAAPLLEAVLDLSDTWLGLRRLETTVFADDTAASALYQRGGFEHEATLRRYAFRQGAWADAWLLARLHRPGAPSSQDESA
ncbi:MAG: GNAT family N-acetyltransferase [Chloroflexi bacterium]|jgi:putative acetyltransferase|nr:GNAT family N-acetyltransferase [Chloroflexota bacterium]